jgi:hypothetical protein
MQQPLCFLGKKRGKSALASARFFPPALRHIRGIHSKRRRILLLYRASRCAATDKFFMMMHFLLDRITNTFLINFVSLYTQVTN